MIHGETATKLEEAVVAARAWLVQLDEATIRTRPSIDGWSIAEVVGHLIDSACNNHQRFIRAQDEGSLSFPKYEQRPWVDRIMQTQTGTPLNIEIFTQVPLGQSR